MKGMSHQNGIFNHPNKNMENKIIELEKDVEYWEGQLLKYSSANKLWYEAMRENAKNRLHQAQQELYSELYKFNKKNEL